MKRRSTHQAGRRQFLVASGLSAGGLALGFHLPAQAQSGTGAEVNAWVLIEPDDSCVIRVARAEMGQGTHTGLAMLVAEELGCDWARVRVQQITPGQNLAAKRVWRNMATGGSRGIRESQEYVRQGGAAARMMLVQAAADEWKVPVGELSVDKGVVVHAASQRKLRYGQLAAAASKLTPPDPKTITLKNPRNWTCSSPAPAPASTSASSASSLASSVSRAFLIRSPSGASTISMSISPNIVMMLPNCSEDTTSAGNVLFSSSYVKKPFSFPIEISFFTSPSNSGFAMTTPSLRSTSRWMADRLFVFAIH